jgi:hypothetical protein
VERLSNAAPGAEWFIESTHGYAGVLSWDKKGHCEEATGRRSNPEGGHQSYRASGVNWIASPGFASGSQRRLDTKMISGVFVYPCMGYQRELL